MIEISQNIFHYRVDQQYSEFVLFPRNAHNVKCFPKKKAQVLQIHLQYSITPMPSYKGCEQTGNKCHVSAQYPMM